jgi:hypothetical protein
VVEALGETAQRDGLGSATFAAALTVVARGELLEQITPEIDCRSLGRALTPTLSRKRESEMGRAVTIFQPTLLLASLYTT